LGKRRAKRSRKVLTGSSQKRSSASAATERGSRPKSKSSRKRHFFYITHGQTNVGFVAQAGNKFTARDADGRKIGIFESLKVASDAVSKNCGGGA
jgi:hypothetical protein